LDPNIAVHHLLIGYSRLLLGQATEAVEPLERARAANPRLYPPHLYLAAAYGLAGRLEEARAALAEHLRLKPDLGSLEAIRTGTPSARHPAHLEQRERTVNVGLRRAGMPDT
jgi:tetratricopeptide (TPR) repeat protein